MHIPDGMLSNTTVAVSGAASIGYLGFAVSWVRKHFDRRKVVLMAVTSALIFALQMLNFPVAAGTSGHFAGGALAAILLGPWAAGIVMTTVLLIQAVVFADGGILALGANILNLAIVAPLVAYGVWSYALKLGSGRAVRVTAAFVAAWASLFFSALAAAAEIWISGNAAFGVVMGAMGTWHALIGIGEGLITAGLIAYVIQVRPDILESEQTATITVKGLAIGFSVIAAAAVALSFLASALPDGLEFVYFEQGAGRPFEESQLVSSPIPDYVIPGLSNDTLAGVLAGIVGIIITGVLLYAVIGSVIRRRGDSGGST